MKHVTNGNNFDHCILKIYVFQDKSLVFEQNLCSTVYAV